MSMQPRFRNSESNAEEEGGAIDKRSTSLSSGAHQTNNMRGSKCHHGSATFIVAAVDRLNLGETPNGRGKMWLRAT